jgi:hypothetical protein
VQGRLTRIVDGGCVGTAKKKDADHRGMVAICSFVKRRSTMHETSVEIRASRNVSEK